MGILEWGVPVKNLTPSAMASKILFFIVGISSCKQVYSYYAWIGVSEIENFYDTAIAIYKMTLIQVK